MAFTWLIVLVIGGAMVALLLWGLLYLLVGLLEAAKPEPPPGENDARWDRDQAREAGAKEEERHSPEG
jgi:hypothetical protein